KYSSRSWPPFASWSTVINLKITVILHSSIPMPNIRQCGKGVTAKGENRTYDQGARDCVDRRGRVVIGKVGRASRYVSVRGGFLRNGRGFAGCDAAAELLWGWPCFPPPRRAANRPLYARAAGAAHVFDRRPDRPRAAFRAGPRYSAGVV